MWVCNILCGSNSSYERNLLIPVFFKCVTWQPDRNLDFAFHSKGVTKELLEIGM